MEETRSADLVCPYFQHSDQYSYVAKQGSQDPYLSWWLRIPEMDAPHARHLWYIGNWNLIYGCISQLRMCTNRVGVHLVSRSFLHWSLSILTKKMIGQILFDPTVFVPLFPLHNDYKVLCDLHIYSIEKGINKLTIMRHPDRQTLLEPAVLTFVPTFLVNTTVELTSFIN